MDVSTDNNSLQLLRNLVIFNRIPFDDAVHQKASSPASARLTNRTCGYGPELFWSF